MGERRASDGIFSYYCPQKNKPMARVRSNLILEGLSGSIGKELTIRVVNGQTIISVKPGKRKKPPSEKQKAQQEKFKQAREWAKTQLLDPEIAAEYKARCTGNQSAMSLLVGEFMKR
jgi:antitoxin component of MazEF toxin-antitoxin module